ncbi:hypothetical protein IAT38_003554 [Cryptococcus sp. DSM 104549]
MPLRAARPLLASLRGTAARAGATAPRARSAVPLPLVAALLADVKYGWKSPLAVMAEAGAGEDLRDDPKSKDPFRVDLETSIPFPLSLQLVTPTHPLTLIGLGVRKVSFLRVKVYSAGFYLQDDATSSLHHIPGWATFTAQHLLTPPTKGETSGPQLSGEALMGNLLDKPVACAVRIVPNRNTDFGHLRDAFTRALQGRQKLARGKGALSEDDEQRITDSIQTLKSFFPSQTVHKGKAVVLLRPPEGGLVVEFDGKVLGRLNDAWVGKELMLTYFADTGVISEKLKEDVALGLEGFVNKQQGPSSVQ